MSSMTRQRVRVKIYVGASVAGTPVQTLTTTRSGGSWSVSASTALGDGTYTAQAEQSDAGGNIGFSTPRSFTVDTLAPAVSLAAPADLSTTTDATPTFSGNAGGATGDGSTVSIDVYSGASASGSPVRTLSAFRVGGIWSVEPGTPFVDGVYTARASQSDSAGNTGSSGANTFIVAAGPLPPPLDTTPPAVSLTAPADGRSTNDTTPTFSGAAGTALGDSTTVSVSVYSGTSASGTAVENFTVTANGGNWSAEASPALSEGTYTAQAEQTRWSRQPRRQLGQHVRGRHDGTRGRP